MNIYQVAIVFVLGPTLIMGQAYTLSATNYASSDGSCSVAPSAVSPQQFTNGGCIRSALFMSNNVDGAYQLTISGNTATGFFFSSNNDCGAVGPASAVTITSDTCFRIPVSATFVDAKLTWTLTTTTTTTTTITASTTAPASAAPCFHKDTVITYNSKDHTFDEIRVHPECSIPHIVHAYGVTITAKCGTTNRILRLTDGHLVYTQRGLQAAGDLKPGQDTLYADLTETTKCQVVSVTKETHQHDYFGLNCLNSQVLASGLKSSTFEKLHSVPAFWMQVMGRILGIKRASAIGDYIAEIVQKMNLI